MSFFLKEPSVQREKGLDGNPYFFFFFFNLPTKATAALPFPNEIGEAVILGTNRNPHMLPSHQFTIRSRYGRNFFFSSIIRLTEKKKWFNFFKKKIKWLLFLSESKKEFLYTNV